MQLLLLVVLLRSPELGHITHNMDEYKGIVKISVSGKDRNFKFGTMQAALFCKHVGCKLSEMPSYLDGNDLDAQISWYWTAAVAYARLFKTEEPSKDEVAAWIDTFGFENMETELAKGVLRPNDQTPLTQEEGNQPTGI